MKLDERCGRRAAAGEAGAADFQQREPIAETACVRVAHDGWGWNIGRATFCRAGFAGRGIAFA